MEKFIKCFNPLLWNGKIFRYFKRKMSAHNPNSNFFKKEDMLSFYKTLPKTNNFGKEYLQIKDKIAIMTHDDNFDMEMYEYGRNQGVEPTFFILTNEIDNFDGFRGDLQLHYNKEYSENLGEQVKKFEILFNKKSIINRNHRFWVREDHLDLAHLSMNGIMVDSSKVGYKPFRLNVQGKLLPIWEVPFSIIDYPCINVETHITCGYNVFPNMEDAFKKGITPIVALFHPYLKDKTNWKNFYKLVKNYKYKLMNMSQFYEVYLKNKGFKNEKNQD